MTHCTQNSGNYFNAHADYTLFRNSIHYLEIVCHKNTTTQRTDNTTHIG